MAGVAVVVGVKFTDQFRFLRLSFCDILENNNISFVFDGHELYFLNTASEEYARVLWKGITGNPVLGQFGPTEL